MNECSGKLHLLLHALTQILDVVVVPIGELEALEPKIRLFVTCFPSQPAQCGKEGQRLSDLHFGIEAALFGQVTNVLGSLWAWLQSAQEFDGAGVGHDDVVDHAQRGCLASAIWAKKAVDNATRRVEAQFADGNKVTVLLGDVADAKTKLRIRQMIRPQEGIGSPFGRRRRKPLGRESPSACHRQHRASFQRRD